MLGATERTHMLGATELTHMLGATPQGEPQAEDTYTSGMAPQAELDPRPRILQRAFWPAV